MQPPPPVTRALLIAMIVLVFLTPVPAVRRIEFTWLALSSLNGNFWPWQVLTYAFVHIDVVQCLINMLVLYLFGPQLEDLWGPKRYIQFLLASALMGAVAFLALTALFFADAPLGGAPGPQLAGASGAIFGMLMAFGVLFPHRRILLFFVADVTMRNAVFIFIGIEVFIMLNDMFSGSAGWVSSVAHLGGMLGGYLMILWWRHRPPSHRRGGGMRR